MSCHLSTRACFALLIAALPLLATADTSMPVTATKSKTVITELLKTTKSWDGVEYRAYPNGQPEVSVMRYTIAPHSALPWHLHRVVNAAYVLSGHLTVERKSDGKSLVIGPGDVLPEMVDAAHRGVTGDESAELIVFYAGTPGVPLVVKVE
ncbi:cupin domain-containing protein [Pseudomonas fluorescens]|uniref:cupin domain-containing protein n=1 Tax=Pseudomonas fluorescens TaxID=294 RepID=UPI001130A574|nr:cupin domain-containing protein [Pseudomonas fluorescens]TMU73934.1 cupin domain-containing protein [Pseudomonas fluorescens]